MKKLFIVFGLIILLSGCATSGVTYNIAKKSFPELSQDKGRIIFYRPAGMFGYGMRPDILIDGKKVGTSSPGTFFIVDVNVGKYKVEIPTIMYPGETTVDVILSAAETIYLKSYIGASAFGGRTNLERVDAKQALLELTELSLFE